jgi:hypothetical protein
MHDDDIQATHGYCFRFSTTKDWHWTDPGYADSLVRPHNLRLAVKKRKILEEEYVIYDCLLLTPTGTIPGRFYRWGILEIQESQIHDFHKSERDEWFQYEKSHREGIYTISNI